MATRRLLVGLSAGAMLLLSSSAYSAEPTDNTAPWKWPYGNGEATVYSSNQHDINYDWGWSGFENIGAASDSDHLVMACFGNPVAKVGIIIDAAAGDLDIYVYDLAGNYLGSSQGVGKTEYVDVQAYAKQAVVMKVYGYNGATGGYSIRVRCP